MIFVFGTLEGASATSRQPDSVAAAPPTGSPDAGYPSATATLLGAVWYVFLLLSVASPFFALCVLLGGLELGGLELGALLGLYFSQLIVGTTFVSVGFAASAWFGGRGRAQWVGLTISTVLVFAPLVIYYGVLGGAAIDRPMRDVLHLVSPASSFVLFLAGDNDPNLGRHWVIHLLLMLAITIGANVLARRRLRKRF